MRYKLGIDVGGTFTDFVLISDDGKTMLHKTLSTPADPSVGVLSGIQDLAGRLGTELSRLIGDITTIVHGTTVATNALLTLNGAKTALVTTRGFRDALEMRRGVREEQYNNHYRNVTPLVPRYLRFTVDERVGVSGRVITPLRVDEVTQLIDQMAAENVEAVAICFMNAYANNAHEDEAARFLRDKLPDCFITASTEVLPSIRFYERVSTTAVNAYIGPIVTHYIDNLLDKLAAIDFAGSLLIMQSNGGVVTPEIVKNSPASTVLSGPAAAPTAGAFYTRLMGYRDCITMDMGGTSFDASMVIDHEAVTSTAGSINRHRVALPSLDIATIGAGGGSIGWIDGGGLLQMGPQSAGASPGPVCYDRGGDKPTCTDADLALGYLNPDYFAGSRIRLNGDSAGRAIATRLAERLGLSVEETAVGMYRIINMNMAQGVRMVSIERGYDPREFLFIVAGGAGPIHAGEICKELEIPLFVVPSVASTLCAAGMLLGDLKHDYVRSYIAPFSTIDRDHLLELYDEMRTTGVETLMREGVDEADIDLYPVLDLRYVGQYHELQLAAPWDIVSSFDLDRIRESFHHEHNRLFGYSLETGATEVELINARLRVIGKTPKPGLSGRSATGVKLDEALKGGRRAYIPERGAFDEIPVYNGDLPLGGSTILGPAIIEKMDTSIFIGASYGCRVDEYGSFVVYNRAVYPDGFLTRSTAEA